MTSNATFTTARRAPYSSSILRTFAALIARHSEGAIAFVMLVWLCGPAPAGELYIYEHNGSIIDWFVVGNNIKATYNKPRPGMMAAGVRENVLLFEGYYEGERIVGKAYAFKPRCAPLPYDVVGREEKNGDIVLRGPAPHWSRGCSPLGYSARSPNAVLLLRYSATHH